MDIAQFSQLNPPPRLLMGPGPINADPRVLRAMSSQLIGQYDPAMTHYMNEVMALYRGVFRTENRWTMLVDGTSRAGIEAILVSAIRPGDKVLVPVFGRFGHLPPDLVHGGKFDRAGNAEARVVHQHVDPPAFRENPRYRGADLAVACNVRSNGADARSLNGMAGQSVNNVARGGKAFRRRKPDPARRARYEHDAGGERCLCHGRSPFSFISHAL